jgi:translation initiation factor IF-3
VRVNEQIRARVVRVVSPDGRHGIYTREKALEMARELGLDLVEIAPHADPPVCKIIDYGKFRYEQQKKEREARKRQQSTEVKEIRLRPVTDTHDFAFKARHAREFLLEGNKVRVYVQFRGRDIVYQERGEEMLARFAQALEDVSRIEVPPKLEGKRLSMILTPDRKKK